MSIDGDYTETVILVTEVFHPFMSHLSHQCLIKAVTTVASPRLRSSPPQCAPRVSNLSEPVSPCG